MKHIDSIYNFCLSQLSALWFLDFSVLLHTAKQGPISVRTDWNFDTGSVVLSDIVQISWQHITIPRIEGFFGARLSKTPCQRESPAVSHDRQEQLLTVTWSIHVFYANNYDDFLFGEDWPMMWQSLDGQQCLHYHEIWTKDDSLSAEISPCVGAKFIKTKKRIVIAVFTSHYNIYQQWKLFL